MDSTLKTLIKTLVEGGGLDRSQMEACFDEILEGEASPAQMAAFVTALKLKGETPEDIAAGATVLRRRAVTVEAPDGAMDLVGTGGDGVGTWNISTAAAFVVAGAGVPVAKHGNKAISSKSGAADVLCELGINLEAPVAQIRQALDTAGICFLMAPRHHSAMRFVGPTRAELGYRTIFNLLGPLSNPALVRRIMVGVFAREWILPFAEALRSLGTTHALVVHGADGLDEVTTTTETHAAMLRDGNIEELTLGPADAEVPKAKPAALVGGTPKKNAKALKALLKGESGPYRDIVVLNAAAALFGGGHVANIADGAAMARESLDSGKALLALDGLVATTNAVDGKGADSG